SGPQGAHRVGHDRCFRAARAGPMTVESAIGRGREERQRFVDRLLAALPGPDEAPVSTNDIGAAFSLGPYERSVLWSVLDKLTRAGLVERVVVDGELVR